MPDGVPSQIWTLVALGAAGFAPARYIWQYVARSPTYRDITQPPEDLGWRTPSRLVLNLAVLAGLVAVAVFSVTPAAARFVQSAVFVPLLLSAFGAAALSTVARAHFTGQIAPLVRGFANTYERETQPKRFWASFAWNAALGGLMLALAPAVYDTPLKSQCSNDGGNYSPADQLSACNTLLAKNPSGAELAGLLADRGFAYHTFGQYERAESDYSRAIALRPDDSYSLYNRALIRRWRGDPDAALKDFDASLRLRSDNEEGYFNRGLLFSDTWRLDKAIADFTRAHELDSDDPWNLANRGLAYAWRDDRAQAEADFAAVEAIDPQNLVMLRGRAVLAWKAGDLQETVRRLSAVLKANPMDAWSLQRRADTYWKLGLHDLARDDDERLDQLRREAARSERRPVRQGAAVRDVPP